MDYSEFWARGPNEKGWTWTAVEHFFYLPAYLSLRLAPSHSLSRVSTWPRHQQPERHSLHPSPPHVHTPPPFPRPSLSWNQISLRSRFNFGSVQARLRYFKDVICVYLFLVTTFFFSFVLRPPWANGQKKSNFGRRGGSYNSIIPSHKYNKINRAGQTVRQINACGRPGDAHTREGEAGFFLYGNIQYSRPHTKHTAKNGSKTCERAFCVAKPSQWLFLRAVSLYVQYVLLCSFNHGMG